MTDYEILEKIGEYEVLGNYIEYEALGKDDDDDKISRIMTKKGRGSSERHGPDKVDKMTKSEAKEDISKTIKWGTSKKSKKED